MGASIQIEGIGIMDGVHIEVHKNPLPRIRSFMLFFPRQIGMGNKVPKGAYGFSGSRSPALRLSPSLTPFLVSPCPHHLPLSLIDLVLSIVGGGEGQNPGVKPVWQVAEMPGSGEFYVAVPSRHICRFPACGS